MRKILFLWLALHTMLCAWSQKKVVNRIKQGEKQTIVVYGTSLCALPDGTLTWPAMLQDSINAIYPDAVEVINSARSAMWSTWGVQNLDEKVLSIYDRPHKGSEPAVRNCSSNYEYADPGAFGKTTAYQCIL